MASMYIGSRTKNVIIFLVVLFSVIFAFVKSDIWSITMKPAGKQGKPSEKAIKMLEESDYVRKGELVLTPTNLKEYIKILDDIVQTNDLNIIFKKETKSNLCELLEIPDEKYNKILSPFLESASLETAERVSSNDFISLEDLKSKIESAKIIRDKVQADLAKSINPYTSKELQKNLVQQRDLVASLKQDLASRKSKQGLVLTKITMNAYFNKTNAIKKSAKVFGLTFAISFVVMTIALLVIYLILIILSKLFSFLGIKSFSKSSSRYSRYGSGYGSGSYGYGKKKVKRIYKRKHKSSSDDEEANKEEEK